MPGSAAIQRLGSQMFHLLQTRRLTTSLQHAPAFSFSTLPEASAPNLPSLGSGLKHRHASE